MNVEVSPALAASESRPYWTLAALCLGALMITLNGTVVNLALASIGRDLGLSEVSLVWVINAYLCTYGGFLLLASRLADLCGPRRVLLSGMTLFTAASLACALAGSGTVLIGARGLQGIGGAIVSATGLSLIMRLFTHINDRARALGIYALVIASGASAGMLLGGVMTGAMGWHWIFFLNVVMGVCICTSYVGLLRADHPVARHERLDVAGAATITAATMLAIYALLNSSGRASSSVPSLVGMAGASALLAMFIRIEGRARLPLVPLTLFRFQGLIWAIVAAALLSAVSLAWSFICGLYLQRVLQWTPLQTGLAFLPANIITALTAFALTPVLVARYGTRCPMMIGFTCAATGLMLLALLLPAHGSAQTNMILGMLLVGTGLGLTYSPVVLAATNAVAAERSAVVTGIVNSSFAVGGALGLAVLATIADATSTVLLENGTARPNALQTGYRWALGSAALLAVTGGVVSALFLRTPVQQPDVRD